MAHAQQSPQFAEVYGELHEHWRAPMLQAMRRGVARGELRRGTDAHLVVDLLQGLLWYRLLVGHRGVSARDARRSVDAALAPCGARRPDPVPGTTTTQRGPDVQVGRRALVECGGSDASQDRSHLAQNGGVVAVDR